MYAPDMFLMYVDESGDTGLCSPRGRSPTRFFCLSGLVVHELHWRETLSSLLAFRHWLKRKYKIYLEDELHASEMLSKPRRSAASVSVLRKHERVAVLRHHLDQINRLPHVRIINVVVDKGRFKDDTPDSVFRRAWYALFQRFENTISRRNFPGPNAFEDRGIVFPDMTDAHQLRRHLASMRVHNPLWKRDALGHPVLIDQPLRLLVEDPICRDSKHSYLVQAADTVAFMLKQHFAPSTYCKEHGVNAYFRTRLLTVLCREASKSDSLGIVRL